MAHDIAPEEGFDNQEMHSQPEETYNPAVDIVIDFPLPGFEELFEGLQEVTIESSEGSAAREPQLSALEVAVMSPNIDCLSNVCQMHVPMPTIDMFDFPDFPELDIIDSDFSATSQKQEACTRTDLIELSLDGRLLLAVDSVREISSSLKC